MGFAVIAVAIISVWTPARCDARELLLRRSGVGTSKDLLFPGVPELNVPALNKVARAIGVEPHEVTRLHSGKIHVCQPWEKCEEDEVKADNKTENMTIVPKQMLGAYEGHECSEWGPTAQGCQCRDYCRCNKKGATCETKIIEFIGNSGGTEYAKCGDFEMGAGTYIDKCLEAPIPSPNAYASTMKIPDMNFNNTLYREYNAHKNKRHLPKKQCFSRDYYCETFPKFPGCDSDRTYRKKEFLTDETKAEIAKCQALMAQGDCEKEEKCGKGEYGTCYPTCTWGEDSPWWFRRLRGKQNQWIKKNKKDPAAVGKQKFLPVLQPSAGVPGVISKDVMKQAGVSSDVPDSLKKKTKAKTTTTTTTTTNYAFDGARWRSRNKAVGRVDTGESSRHACGFRHGRDGCLSSRSDEVSLCMYERLGRVS